MTAEVVILVQRPAMEPEALDFAAALEADGRFAPRLIYEGSARRRRQEPAKPSSAPARPRPTWKSATLGVIARLQSFPASDAGLMALYMARAKRWFDREVRGRAKALVLFDDRAPITNLYILRLAREAGVATLILPYAHTDPESDAMLRRGRAANAIPPGLASAPRRWLARRHPNQARATEHGQMFFYGYGATALLAAMGLGDTKPWVLGGGGADVVGVDGPEDAERRIAQGAPADRVRFVGQPSHDRLARTRGLAPAEKLALLPTALRSGDRPLAIVAVPQYAEHGMLPWPQHWAVTEELLSAVAASGARLLLSLHPKSRPEDYAAVAARHRAAVAERPLAELLPLADVFVATYSSTVGWAIRLGIPTVISDLPRQDMQTFAAFQDIPVATTGAALASAVARLVDDPAERAATGARLLAAGARLGLIDGAASRRAIDALKDALSSKGHAP